MPELTGQTETLDSSYLGFWLIDSVSEGIWCTAGTWFQKHGFQNSDLVHLYASAIVT